MARDDRIEFVWRAGTVALIAIAAVIFLWILETGAQVMLMAFGGVMLALTLRRLARVVARLPHVSANMGLVVVLALIVGVLVLGGYLMASRIAIQVDELVNTVPQSLEKLERYLASYGWTGQLMDELRNAEGMLPQGSDVVARATGLFSTGLGWIVSTVVILFVGVYGAIQPRLYVDAVVRLVPPPRRQRAAQVLEAIETTLWRWLIGRLAGMVIIGILTSVGLLVLGVPLAITLGVLSALLAFIPYLGPILSAAFAALLALTVSPQVALYTLLLYAGVQVIESYFMTPLIERQAVLLPPALTITTQVLLGVLLGGLALLLASPLVATAMVLVKMLYLEDFLGESVTLPGSGKAHAGS